MKLQWFGKCSFTSISSIHLIGTIEAQCPPSSSSMVLYLQLSIRYSISGLALKFIMRCSASFVSLGCTNTTSTRRILQPSVLQSYTWPLYSLGAYVGLVTVFSAITYLTGLSIHKDMLCGTSSWASIPTSQMHFWCFAGPNNEGGPLRLFISWAFSLMWRSRNRKPNDEDTILRSWSNNLFPVAVSTLQFHGPCLLSLAGLTSARILSSSTLLTNPASPPLKKNLQYQGPDCLRTCWHSN